MAAKLTKEVVNQRLADRGIVLVGEYVRNHTKALFECGEGHQWRATPANVMYGCGCPHCAGTLPLTKEIVNERLADRAVTLIGKYTTTATSTQFRCDKCANEWDAKPSNILHGTGCPRCSLVERGLNHRLSTDIVKERLAGRGIELVGEYQTSNTKTQFRCAEGHVWEAVIGSVMGGNGCPVCSGRVPLTKKIVNDRIAERGIVLLSECGGSTTKGLFRCRYGHTWETGIGNVARGSGCPHCDGQAPLSKDVVNERIADRGLVMLGKYRNVDTKTLFRCTKGHEWEAAPEKVMRRTGCPYCSRQAPLTTDAVNERIASRGLVLVDDFVTNSVRVRFRCDKGHVWSAKPNNILNGRDCPDCSDRSSDFDLFYLWAAIDQDRVALKPGERLIKYGATSQRLGQQRILEVARDWDTTPQVVALVQTKMHANLIEGTAAKYGRKLSADYVGLDGYTEFRIVTDSELSQLMQIADVAAKTKIIWDDPVSNVREFQLFP